MEFSLASVSYVVVQPILLMVDCACSLNFYTVGWQAKCCSYPGHGIVAAELPGSTKIFGACDVKGR